MKWYYAQNTIPYARRTTIDSQVRLAEAYARTKGAPIRVVHPTKYLSVADVANVPLRRVLRTLPVVVRHGIRRTLRLRR